MYHPRSEHLVTFGFEYSPCLQKYYSSHQRRVWVLPRGCRQHLSIRWNRNPSLWAFPCYLCNGDEYGNCGWSGQRNRNGLWFWPGVALLWIRQKELYRLSRLGDGPTSNCDGDGEINILDAIKIVNLILERDECPWMKYYSLLDVIPAGEPESPWYKVDCPMLTIRCAACREKIFKYKKMGKGRLWHCWKNRIIEDYSVRGDHEVRCKCGHIIGIDEQKWIKLKQHSFTISGTITRK